MSKQQSADQAVPVGHRPRSRGYMPNWPAVAKAYWGGSEVVGNGRWASVSRCPPTVTIHLHPTEDEAQASKSLIDATGCGGRCRNDHDVVDLAQLVARG